MKIVVYSKHGEEFVPKVAKKGSVGYDIMCPYDVVLSRNMPFHFMDLGIVLKASSVPEDLVTQNNNWGYLIVPRSSSSKVLLTYSNTIGVVEPTYDGPEDTLKVAIQFNISLVPEHIQHQWCMDADADVYGRGIRDLDDDGWGPIAKDVQAVPYDKEVFITIEKGERIGQILFMSFLMPDLEYGGKMEDHPSYGIGDASRGGFGSTGK